MEGGGLVCHSQEEACKLAKYPSVTVIHLTYSQGADGSSHCEKKKKTQKHAQVAGYSSITVICSDMSDTLQGVDCSLC